MPDRISREEIEDIMSRYKERLGEEIAVDSSSASGSGGGVAGGSGGSGGEGNVASKEFRQFKRELVPPEMSLYEKLCKTSGKVLNIKLKKEKEQYYQELIDISHLEITPTEAYSFSLFIPLLFMFFGAFFSYIFLGSLFFVAFFILVGVSMIPVLAGIPSFIANSWRMKATNQMVLCVFYIVTQMRHNPNLELAVRFAADHLAPPLSTDLKKVLWNVETGKYESLRDAMDHYLETWRKWNNEFIESLHLVESSLYESSEERRLSLLDKALDVMLTETFEKMLHFAHNLRGPITTLNMLGVILPILGLVILPLAVSFMEGIKWYHLAALYNVILPAGVYILGKNILSTRPTGYGDTDIAEENPGLRKYRNILVNVFGYEIKINPVYLSVFIFTLFFLMALLPPLMHFFAPHLDVPIIGDNETGVMFLEYRPAKDDPTTLVGPFGIGASLLSLFFPLAIGLPLGLYYKLKSEKVIKIRENSKKLEGEFASALFQLGNRLGDGLPAEIAFGKVAEVMQDTISGKFFRTVSNNVSKMGLGLQEAIFNPKTGALAYYPSSTIESSMKVLLESMKKGPRIAAQALMSISTYIKEIHKVDERLKDLMAEVISSMQSQVKFMTPAIAGIVIGITSMITTILGKVGKQLNTVGGPDAEQLAGVTDMFGDGIPTYYFQIAVGIYVVQIIYILTIMANGIENGSDKLNERYTLGKNLVRGTLMYCMIAGIVMLLFNFVAQQVLRGTVGG